MIAVVCDIVFVNGRRCRVATDAGGGWCCSCWCGCPCPRKSKRAIRNSVPTQKKRILQGAPPPFHAQTPTRTTAVTSRRIHNILFAPAVALPVFNLPSCVPPYYVFIIYFIVHCLPLQLSATKTNRTRGPVRVGVVRGDIRYR